MSARIDALEETVAHQSRTIDELSEELRRQGDLLERLRAELLTTREQVMRVEDALGPIEQQKPPHY